MDEDLGWEQSVLQMSVGALHGRADHEPLFLRWGEGPRVRSAAFVGIDERDSALARDIVRD